MKGCICHFVKLQTHSFISKGRHTTTTDWNKSWNVVVTRTENSHFDLHICLIDCDWIDRSLHQCWSSDCDAGPTLIQHCFNTPCLLLWFWLDWLIHCVWLVSSLNLYNFLVSSTIAWVRGVGLVSSRNLYNVIGIVNHWMGAWYLIRLMHSSTSPRSW